MNSFEFQSGHHPNIHIRHKNKMEQQISTPFVRQIPYILLRRVQKLPINASSQMAEVVSSLHQQISGHGEFGGVGHLAASSPFSEIHGV